MSIFERPHLQRPHPHHWDYTEWDFIVSAGVFDGKRVELIGGEIIDMSPQLVQHVKAVTRAASAMRKVFSESVHWVRVQAPLWLGSDSGPEPDVSVTKGAESNYSETHHPTTALIVIEVSQTSLKFDRGDKASLYASAAIPDYWIINLENRQLEVHRKPVKDARQRFGHRYSKITILKSGDSIAPLAAKTKRIAVADLLP